MKPLVPFLLLSSLFLLSSSAAEAADAVLDNEGNAVKRGAEYYVLPSPGIGGGLTLASRNETCPLFVVMESSEVDSGLPVTFFPVDEGDDTVRLSTDTNIVFSASTLCLQGTVWTLENDESTGRFYVAAGGVVGNPSRETLSNWFKIEKVEEGSYKLAFCPQVCNVCRPRCGDLGFFLEDGKEWLGLDGSPFSVMFKKV